MTIQPSTQKSQRAPGQATMPRTFDKEMKDPNEHEIRSVLPTSSSVIGTYAFAAFFIAAALYFSYQDKFSPFPFMWMLGFGWLGRAVEKTSLLWKVSRLSSSSKNDA